ncbi:MAG: hypothetical protein PHU80_05720 [Kiritimatiellae bacterium]|nr:hypothetical protein [Kiritimatiellia bacterium]
MRTRFVSVIRSRAFKMRLWIWCGVAALLFVAAMAAALLWLAGHHLVTTDHGLVVVPKRYVRMGGTRADVRGWTWDDAVANIDVSHALISAGYEDVLPDPPAEPSVTERAAVKARQLKEQALEAGTNTWQKLKEKLRKSEPEKP